jgi:hypothetical protein
MVMNLTKVNINHNQIFVLKKNLTNNNLIWNQTKIYLSTNLQPN